VSEPRVEPRVEVQPDADALATAVAGELLSRLADLQAAGAVPQIGLTGGTIARAVHREMARLSPESGVDWGAVVVWFGDERFVPAGSEDRNAGQARADLLDVVGASRVHEIPSSDDAPDAEAAADAYSATMREHGAGSFDVLMLGIGPDGHVASLFPGHPALAVDAIAVAVHDSPKPPPDRVSLALPCLNRADAVWFMASGDGKADAVAAALADGPVEEIPARGVSGLQETTWFLDRDAASRL
jgi:6-phosphogluconolactonase